MPEAVRDRRQPGRDRSRRHDRREVPLLRHLAEGSHEADAQRRDLQLRSDALEQIPTLPVRGEVRFEVELLVATGPRERF